LTSFKKGVIISTYNKQRFKMTRHFPATEVAKRFKMNVKTAQRWAKATDWRSEVYNALQYKMLKELSAEIKDMK
jgi:hypothetical protein